MEFSEEIINKELNLSHQDIADLLITAIEGGINYWGGVLKEGELWENKPKGVSTSEWVSKLILEGKSVNFYDVEGAEDDSEWILTMDKLIEGIKFNQTRNHKEVCYYDVEDADCVIQYALFRDIVFG